VGTPERTKMIFRMEREERFQAVRPYLRRDVIVTARPARTTPTGEAEHFPGRVEAVAWSLLDGDDVLVLLLTGPEGQGMPLVSIELSKIIGIKELAGGR
jgi:hypothetical protein